MKWLPPPSYVPSSVAVIYLIGHILSAETCRTEAESDLPSFLKRDCPPFAIVPPEGSEKNTEDHDTAERFELKTTKVEIVEAQYQSNGLHHSQGVRVSFVSKDKRPFYELAGIGYPPRGVTEIAMTLRPPYQSCLHPDRIRESVDADNFHRMPRTADIPVPGPMQRFRLVCPSSMPAAAGRELKQALADEIITAIVIEENGVMSEVQPGFWRTQKADVALAQDVLMSVPLKDRVAVGYVFMSADAIRDRWAQILRLAPLKRSDHRYSPYIELAIKVSDNLQLRNGRDVNEARLDSTKVREEIEKLWNEFIPKKMNKTELRVEHLATLIRHPLDEHGGFLSGKKPKAEAPEPVPPKSGGARPPMGGNAKTR